MYRSLTFSRFSRARVIIAVSLASCLLLLAGASLVPAQASQGQRALIRCEAAIEVYGLEAARHQAGWDDRKGAEIAEAGALILDSASISTTDISFHASTIPYAGAVPCMRGSNRHHIVIYNPTFLRRLASEARTRWATSYVLAHEIGHIVNNHFEASPDQYKHELEADRFAGSALARLGAPRIEAAAALWVIGTRRGTQSHPAGATRVGEVERGWDLAMRGRIAGLPPPPPLADVFQTLPQPRQGDPRGEPSTSPDSSSRPPPPYPQRSVTQFEERPNTWVQGAGTVGRFNVGNLAECRSLCAKHQACRMFELYRPTMRCGLFEHTRTAGHAPDAHVGVRLPTAVASVGFRVLSHRWVVGEGDVDVIRRTTADVCRGACWSEPSCRMYEFYRPNRTCGLYSHTHTRNQQGRDTAEVGMKLDP